MYDELGGSDKSLEQNQVNLRLSILGLKYLYKETAEAHFLATRLYRFLFGYAYIKQP